MVSRLGKGLRIMNTDKYVTKAILAVNELTDMLEFFNATQIATTEAYLAGLGLTKLAEIAREYGLGNAGQEYLVEYEKACGR